MMHYAQVILEAKSLGFNEEQATDFARRVVTAAALMAMMPEDVLKAWNGGSEASENRELLSVMSDLELAAPCRAA